MRSSRTATASVAWLCRTACGHETTDPTDLERLHTRVGEYAPGVARTASQQFGACHLSPFTVDRMVMNAPV